MAKTLDKAVELVAQSFVDTMKEEGFDTFAEMRDCYWWTTNDIKEEVEYMLQKDADDLDDYTVYDDGQDVGNARDFIPYRQFMKQVYARIKKLR